MNGEVIELASKPVERLSDNERQLIVSRIEGIVEFSNKKELTGMPTTGEAATVEVTHLKSPSTHTILKMLYAVNGAPRRALFVSRMHPKKGVLELVEAWARLKHSNNPNIRTIEH